MVDKLVNSEANKRRIKFVDECFKGSSGQQSLYEAGRVLVGEGVLTKICRKKPKPRQFFLFNDIIVYGNILINKKKYNKQRVIPLEEVKISSLTDAESSEGLKNGWIISSGQKSFAVYAATLTEKQEWMAHIDKCVRDYIERSGKGGVGGVAGGGGVSGGGVEHAAVWIPDQEANTCMHCRKSQFTIINRRHHCRKCGKVVCGPCSNKRFLLPNQSAQPLRVCLSCYDTLSKGYRDIHQQQQDESGVAAAGDTAVGAGEESSGEETSDDDLGAAGSGSGSAATPTSPTTAAGAAAGNDEPPETTFYSEKNKVNNGGDSSSGATGHVDGH